MARFKDNFSKQSSAYARFRPKYPDRLFEFLASLCREHELAWDCATGNGQSAVPLARLFDSVVATDASEKQLANAERHPRIEYRVAPAERSGLPSGAADLITVSQAMHWFRIDEFWTEAKRVLRPEGVIAVWCYVFVEITAEIDAVVNRYYSDIVGPYWDFERKLVEDGYQSLDFPFAEVEAPNFAIETSWSLSHLIGYLQSWSASQKFIAANNLDPTELIAADLAAKWGNSPDVRPVRWPLRMRVGRNMSRNS
jgi:SAM-dependent methyltransferase